MFQAMAQKRASAILVGLLIICLILFVGCSGNSEPDDIEAAVSATVAVAVEQTVTALGAGSGESASGESAANTSAVQVAQSSQVEQPAEAVAAAPGDNSRAITDYLLANGRHFIGNPNADVVIIEFSDFQ